MSAVLREYDERLRAIRASLRDGLIDAADAAALFEEATAAASYELRA